MNPPKHSLKSVQHMSGHNIRDIAKEPKDRGLQTPDMDGDCLLVIGPCSIDDKNIHEVMDMSKMTITDRSGISRRAIAGTRVVGIKSRTELDTSGKGMGMDHAVYEANLAALMKGTPLTDLALAPSAQMSIDIYQKTNMLIATEVCSPLIQLAPLRGHIPAGKMLPWNPAVNQLGWPLHEMGVIAAASGWKVGIKNGKWLGESIVAAESAELKGQTPLEKVWIGLSTYASVPKDDVFLIQRGIETVSKGDYRSLPIHETARRAKNVSGIKVLFDPSHSLGPKMRMHIVAATIDAMRMTMPDGSWLYDGALIEAGTSATDTAQHITLDEVSELIEVLATFRNLISPV